MYIFMHRTLLITARTNINEIEYFRTSSIIYDFRQVMEIQMRGQKCFVLTIMIPAFYIGISFSLGPGTVTNSQHCVCVN